MLQRRKTLLVHGGKHLGVFSPVYIMVCSSTATDSRASFVEGCAGWMAAENPMLWLCITNCICVSIMNKFCFKSFPLCPLLYQILLSYSQVEIESSSEFFHWIFNWIFPFLIISFLQLNLKVNFRKSDGVNRLPSISLKMHIEILKMTPRLKYTICIPSKPPNKILVLLCVFPFYKVKN